MKKNNKLIILIFLLILSISFIIYKNVLKPSTNGGGVFYGITKKWFLNMPTLPSLLPKKTGALPWIIINSPTKNVL